MSEELSRIGIFVFFDPQGIVDEYVLRLLDALRPNLKKLVVVSNCQTADSDTEKLSSHCDQLFFRENRGMDAAAFKAGMVTFCGWDQLQNYDEVVLINDTFFGPIHSFQDMFREMAGKDLDFWGMSAGYQQEDGWGLCKYGYIPDHIQTFFVAFRKKMVESSAFQEYWNNYNDRMTSFEEVVTGHEIVMTKHFEDLGFTWDTYAQSQKYRSQFREENFNIYFYRSCEMMRDMRFPAFKKKVLNADMKDLLYMNDLEDAAASMEYIKNHTDYDSNLIWDNVLRLYHMEDLYHSLHLNYIFSSEPAEDIRNAALVFHLTDPGFLSLFMDRASRLSEFLPVYLIPDGKVTADQCRELLKDGTSLQILEGSAQDTEMGAFVLRCRELSETYEFLGFLHDVQNPDHIPAVAGESLVRGYVQNIAEDPGYISRILRCFRENPRLGLLGSPFPIHYDGFENYEDTWNGWYPSVRKTADQWKLRAPLSQDKQPLLKTGAFWCRTEALKPLFRQSWTPEDFKRSALSLDSRQNEILKRILPYAAQSEGFYSGIVMHSDYASMRITGQEVMLRDIVSTTKKQLEITSETFPGYLDQLKILNTGKPEGKVTVDLSEIGILFLLKHIMLRYLPKKSMEFLRKLRAYLKRRA